MTHVSSETYTWQGDVPVDRAMDNGIQYPYLLVNVGSGVGFILVNSEHSWERVSGTSLGGGTFFGLSALLTGETSFDRMLDSAEGGDNAAVDLTVGDIYGRNYDRFGLKASTIASSFGKAVMWAATGGGGVGGGNTATTTTPAVDTELHRGNGSGSGSGSSSASAAQVDGSYKGLGRVSIGRGAAMQLPTPTTMDEPQASRGYATPLMHREWDPAAVLAAVSEALTTDEKGEIDEGAADSETTTAAESTKNVEKEQTQTSSSSSPSRATHVPSPLPTPTPPPPPPPSSWKACDAHRSLLIMISNNIGQLAYLNALKHHCRHIYFAGNFLRVENTIAMRTLAYAITFWSKGTMEAFFVRHEGYCGALGAFLSTLESVD